MDEIRIKIYTREITQRRSVLLKDEDGSILNLVVKVFECDCDVSHLHRYGIQMRNTQKTRDAFNQLALSYSKQIPNLLKFKALSSHLSEGEEFYLIYADKASDIECRIAIETLNSMNGNVIPEIVYNEIYAKYIQQGFDFDFYSYGFDGLQVYVGEKTKDLRKCRFCGATGKDKFGDDAHAIQDSLGNKLLICYEECDKCNHTLNKIEDNFLRLMDVRRALYQIPRKSGKTCPHIIGRNYVIKPNAVGQPEVFLMKEEIPQGTDVSKPFCYTLIHKQHVTNENVLKALSKMVIDLIPSKYLPELQNTIKWIKAIDGTWAVDDLPSFLNAILPSSKFFKQPVLDLFLRKNDDGQSPYCTALLWIYDMVYMFALPLVDADRGRFKSDVNLQNHWKRMSMWYNQLWTMQNTSDWKEAKVWVKWQIDPSDPSFHILPAADPVFNESRKKKLSPPDEKFPSVNPEDISVCKVKAKFTNYYHGRTLTDADLIDLTQHITPLQFFLTPKHSRVTLTLAVDVNNQNDTELWFSFNLKVTFKLKNFGRNIRIRFFKNGNIESFAIDLGLCDVLFERMLNVCESQLSVKRAKTNFASADITRLRHQSERFIESSSYHISMKSGECVISDRVVHFRIYDE